MNQAMNNVVDMTNTVVNEAPALPVFELIPADLNLPELAMKFPAATCTNPGAYARLVPSEPEGYYVQAQEAKKAIIWASTASLKQSLLLTGETGTGKTEFVTFLAARLGIPLARVECHSSMTPDILDGGIRLTPSETGEGIVTKYILSDVMRIYRDGGWILLDEVDKVSDEVSSRLHALADGKPVTIPETGEVIYKHPFTKVWGTSNTVGDGTSMRYITSRPLDAAFRARWAVLVIDYLKPAEELEMLEKAYPKFRKGFLQVMVQLANACRDAALGEKRDGVVDRPMSTIYAMRSQRNILNAALAFGPNTAFYEAVNFAFRGMCDSTDQQVFDGICQHVLGVELSQTLMTTKTLNERY